MASIVSRSNGTYLVRGSCGVDSNGKQIARSKTFKPSKPNLPYSKLNRELEAFVAAFEQEIENEDLMPMFARLKMKDLRTYHIQQFVQYLATEKKRLDGREGGIAASTVKRYILFFVPSSPWRISSNTLRTISVKRSIYKLSDDKTRSRPYYDHKHLRPRP